MKCPERCTNMKFRFLITIALFLAMGGCLGEDLPERTWRYSDRQAAAIVEIEECFPGVWLTINEIQPEIYIHIYEFSSIEENQRLASLILFFEKVELMIVDKKTRSEDLKTLYHCSCIDTISVAPNCNNLSDVDVQEFVQSVGATLVDIGAYSEEPLQSRLPEIKKARQDYKRKFGSSRFDGIRIP